MRSRRACWRFVEALPWSDFEGIWFLTLTYPGEEAAEFIPRNGRVAKKHIEAFCKRWHRTWGKPLGVWKMEFQKRGAVHFHLWIGNTEKFLHPDEIRERRDWCGRVWWEIVGSGSQDHLKAGTQLDLLNGQHPSGYFKAYLSRKNPHKEIQNRVPPDFVNPGRFWGAIGGFRPHWVETVLTAKEFFKLRRLGGSFMRSRNRRRKRRVFRMHAGLFVVASVGFGWKFAQIIDEGRRRAAALAEFLAMPMCEPVAGEPESA